MAELFKGRPIFVSKFWEVCDLEKVVSFYGDNATVNILKTVELLFGKKYNHEKERKQCNVTE
jgi:hypothetical protein